MNLPMPAILIFALLVCPWPTLSIAWEPPNTPQEPVRIIFDTDMDTDCDDLGALAVLHALADLGEAEILATVVSSKNSWSPACVAAVNTYYGRLELPVGHPKGPGADRPSRYARQIAEQFPQQLGTGQQVPDAAEIYRRVLSEQPDASLVIVTVGYLTNLADLLRLPADGDLPSGKTLIQQKVRRWVCMGGNGVTDCHWAKMSRSRSAHPRDGQCRVRVSTAGQAGNCSDNREEAANCANEDSQLLGPAWWPHRLRLAV